MINKAKYETTWDFIERQFDLPFTSMTIRPDRDGARHVAWLACKMAAANSSPLESDKGYARRFAAFVAGMIASQCTDDAERFYLFRDFLSQVYVWLERCCNECGESHDWSIFGDGASEAQSI